MIEWIEILLHVAAVLSYVVFGISTFSLSFQRATFTTSLIYLVRDLIEFNDHFSKVAEPGWNPFQKLGIMITKPGKKNFGPSARCPSQREISVITSFSLLKLGLEAIFEVMFWASWRSTIGPGAIFPSSLTQILEIWSQNQFFPPGSLEDGCLPERRILPQFPNKAFLSIVFKTKVAPNDQKTY